MGNPCVVFQRHLHFAMKQIIEVGVHDDKITEQDINTWVCPKKGFDRLKTPWQVLFVAVEISEDVARGSVKTTVDAIVHSAIGFDERLHACVASQPLERPIG